MPLVHVQLWHRSRTTSPVRRELPDITQPQTPHHKEDLKVIARTARLITGSVFLFTTVIANFLSPSCHDCRLECLLHSRHSDTCDLLL